MSDARCIEETERRGEFERRAGIVVLLIDLVERDEGEPILRWYFAGPFGYRNAKEPTVLLIIEELVTAALNLNEGSISC